MPPLLVLGICGGSGSGKTTIATKLLSGFQERNKRVGLIAMDSYYCDLSHLSLKERSAWNFDHPKAFETALLIKHIQALKDGDAISIPVYDFQQHLRTKQVVRMAAPEILIIEGILLFADPELQRMLDIKIFVDASPDVRLVRRLRRDVVERGRSVDQVCNQYLQTVREMHEEFVEPWKDSAHIVVPNNGYKGMGDNYHVVIDLVLNRYGASTAAGHSSTSASPLVSVSPTPTEKNGEGQQEHESAEEEDRNSPAKKIKVR